MAASLPSVSLLSVARDTVAGIGRHSNLAWFTLLGIGLALCGMPLVESYVPQALEFGVVMSLLLVMFAPIPLIAAIMRDLHGIPESKLPFLKRLINLPEMRLLGVMVILLFIVPLVWVLIVDIIGTVVGALSFSDGGSLLLFLSQHGVSPEAAEAGEMPIVFLLGVYGLLMMPLIFITARLMPSLALVVVRDISLARALSTAWVQTKGLTLKLSLRLLMLLVVALVLYAVAMLLGALVNGFGDLASELVAGAVLAVIVGLYMNAAAAVVAGRSLPM